MFISDETLRIIHLVARHQSITTATEQLNRVSSAISCTIEKVEENLGVELFIRKGRYTELSPAGSYFIEHSKTILDDLEVLKRNTVLIHNGIERKLIITVNNIILDGLLVASIRDFERQFTSTTLMVDLETYNDCWDALYSKRADLIYGVPYTVPGSEGIINEPVGQIKWDFVVSPPHPLVAKQHPLENSELRHYPAVRIRDTSVNFPSVQAWLLEGQKPILVPDSATTIVLIEQNVDIGYIPHHLALPSLSSGELPKEPMRGRKHATKLFLVAHSDGMDKAYQRYVGYLRDPQLIARFVFS